MKVTCGNCKAELVIAGGYRRQHPNHPQSQGAPPPDGWCTWGVYTCHHCGATVTVEPDRGEKQ